MQNIQLTTKDGITFNQVGDVIKAVSPIGSFVGVGDEGKYTYYTTLLDITDLQKITFENRVREIIREVTLLSGKL